MSFLWVDKEFKTLAPVSLSAYCIYGGAAYESQESPLQLGIDILVGIPGWILGHVTRGSFDLSELRSVKRVCSQKFGTKFHISCMQLQGVKFKVLKLFLCENLLGV